jgi:hypothetical protein
MQLQPAAGFQRESRARESELSLYFLRPHGLRIFFGRNVFTAVEGGARRAEPGRTGRIRVKR